MKIIYPASLLLTLSLMFASCSDEGDTPDSPVEPSAPVSEYGFVSVDATGQGGTIYVNTTDYGSWTYLNFKDKTYETLAVDATPTGDWDIALHRYDAKTNGGEVAEEGSDVWVADVWTTDRIIVDMSNMMNGEIGYTESYYNPLLSQWLDVNTNSMPPSYTLSGKTYIVKLKDGRKVSLKLLNFMDDNATKGFLTIQYSLL
ncbi:MAG: HmuY family protein [Lepagella sp.]